MAPSGQFLLSSFCWFVDKICPAALSVALPPARALPALGLLGACLLGGKGALGGEPTKRVSSRDQKGDEMERRLASLSFILGADEMSWERMSAKSVLLAI